MVQQGYSWLMANHKQYQSNFGQVSFEPMVPHLQMNVPSNGMMPTGLYQPLTGQYQMEAQSFEPYQSAPSLSPYSQTPPQYATLTSHPNSSLIRGLDVLQENSQTSECLA